MAQSTVSVLTPTYNRAHVLHRVYDSLSRQKTRDFEWVVVDDGSTDETPALLARWQLEADFPIAWFRYSNNRGKHAAINTGKKFLSGDFVMLLDSDDALVNDAMDKIAEWRMKTEIDSLPKVCGLVFRCVDESGNIVGKLKSGKNKFPEETILTSTRAARYQLGISFDFIILQKTETFSNLIFGELDRSENFPPSIGVNRISDIYDVIFIDHPIRIYYRNDGIARLSDKPSRQVKWPRGNYLRALAILNNDIDFFWSRPKVFLNAARKVTRLGLHIGRPPHTQFSDMTNSRARLLWMVSIIGGSTGYLRDRIRGRTAPKADLNISAWGPADPPENPMHHPPPERFCQSMLTETSTPGKSK